MRFYEYEAKALFARHGTPLLRGRVARTAAEAAGIARDLAVPVVLKSQVLTGGRMKAGGVKFADTPDAAEAAARAILALEIKGQRPPGVLVEICLGYDPPLAAINPLGKTEDGRFLVLDGHVDLEGDARDKHAKLLQELGIGKEETREARPPTEFELKGARVDASDHRGVAGNVREFDGDLGLVIGAGGGSLTLFDAIRKHGGRPANYCEIGGNPRAKKACELTKLILSKPGVKKIAVMMNVVSNTRVDIVARGVIKGCVEAGRNPAETIAIFRIPGAWEDDGFTILRKYGVEYCDRTVSMYEAAGRAVAKMQGVAA